RGRVLAELAQERVPKIVIVDLNEVARRRAVPTPPPAHFAGAPCGDIRRALEHTLDLKRRDAGLMVGEAPDASDRLKQADEEQVFDLRMHHGQIERRELREVRS